MFVHLIFFFIKLLICGSFAVPNKMKSKYKYKKNELIFKTILNHA
jgi:hypothetical protein